MTATITTVSEDLRAVADLIEAHPNLPVPYVTAGATRSADVHWFLHISEYSADLAGQKRTAAQIVSALGGKWDKGENGGRYTLTQERPGGGTLYVTVNRAAVCERVVTGSHEVTMPATPARDAEPERVETVEDVTWRCSSLLAEPVAS